MTRREFTLRENERLGRFLDVEHVVGWGRSYRCECGFACHAPGDIYDHTQQCSIRALGRDETKGTK